MTQIPLVDTLDLLTVKEAAQEISSGIGRTVEEADVLWLALHGRLTLAVDLPDGTTADCWDVPEDLPEDRYDDLLDVPELTRLTPARGIWNLPIVPPAHMEITARRNRLLDLPSVPLEGLIGATVERSGVRCRLRKEGTQYSSPASVIPKDSVILVHRSSIAAYVAAASERPPRKKLRDPTRLLVAVERRKILSIIFALARMTHTDIKPHLPTTVVSDRIALYGILAALARKAGMKGPRWTRLAEIVTDTELHEQRVTARCVEDHLNDAFALFSESNLPGE